jgi:hypothetical protein
VEAVTAVEMATVTLGSAAPSLRRRLGPLAWCALEALYGRAQLSDGGLVTDSSLLVLAGELGVAKNTAHRAVKTLRSAGLVELEQTRNPRGRFDATTYRLAVPDDVLRRQLPPTPAVARPPRGARRVGGRRPVAVPAVGGFDEQLVLVPLA